MTTLETLAAARQCQQSGDPLRAEQLCGQVLAADPAHAPAWHLLGQCRQARGLADEAVRHYQHALRLRPDLTGAHTTLGMSLLRLGELNDALACCREAVRRGPQQSATHNGLGLVLEQLGQFDEALACYQEALRLDPDSREAHVNRA